MKSIDICPNCGEYRGQLCHCQPKKTKRHDWEAELKKLIDEKKQSAFVLPDTASDADALGILISQYFEWDGLEILKTMYAALEDANFHTENKTVEGWIKNLEKEI